MKDWNTQEVSETETGMEVTSYMPAELDRAQNVSLQFDDTCLTER